MKKIRGLFCPHVVRPERCNIIVARLSGDLSLGNDNYGLEIKFKIILVQ